MGTKDLSTPLATAEFCSGEVFYTMNNPSPNPEHNAAFITNVTAAKRLADQELERQRKLFMFGDASEQLGCEGQARPAPKIVGASPLAAEPLSLTAMCAALENARRGGDGTMDIKPSGHPDDDYAAALNFLARGLHHLEEGLPNAQAERVRLGFLSMERGMHILGAFLKARGVV